MRALIEARTRQNPRDVSSAAIWRGKCGYRGGKLLAKAFERRSIQGSRVHNVSPIRHPIKICRELIFCLILLSAFYACSGSATAAAPRLTCRPSPCPLIAITIKQPRICGKGWQAAQRLSPSICGNPDFPFAICHTFFASRFLSVAHDYEHRYDALVDFGVGQHPPSQGEERADELSRIARHRDRLRFKATLFHFLGEVEVVFGIWLIPLAIAIVAFKGWTTMVDYFDGVEYTEPIFVFVVMAIASSKPILRFAESCLSLFAAIGGKTPLPGGFRF